MLGANSQFSSTLLNEISSLVGALKPDASKRIAMALRFCRNEGIMKSLSTYEHYHTTLFGQFTNNKLLADEELLEIGPDLVDAAPRAGHAGAELALLQIEADQKEAALQSYEKGIAALSAHGATLYSKLHLGKAKLLADLQKAGAALELLESMDQERLSSGSKEEYASLKYHCQIRREIETGKADQVIPVALARFETLEDKGVAYHDLAVALAALGGHAHEGAEYKAAAAYRRLALAASSLASKRSSATQQEGLLEALSESLIEAGVLMAPETLITKGAKWKYLDDGSDQGAAWREFTFDDAAWSEGQGELGYGDGDEATELSYGPDSDKKFITTYFRHGFTVPSGVEITNARLELLRDDGAAVYLNGKEMARQNLPEGEITHETLAPNASSGRAEKTYHVSEVASEGLRAGDHVLAVEVHQRSADSPDVSFDLTLVANDLSDETIFTAMNLEALEVAIGAETWQALPSDLRGIDQLPLEGGDENSSAESGPQASPTPPVSEPSFRIEIVP